MRQRQRVEVSTPQARERTRSACSGIWTTNLTRRPPLHGSQHLFFDVVVPDFLRRKSRGELIFNPMSSSRYEYTETGRWSAVRTVGTSSCSGVPDFSEWDCTGPWLGALLHPAHATLSSDYYAVSPKLVSDLELGLCVNEAALKCRSKIGQSTASMIVTLAKTRKIVELCTEPLRQLNAYLSNIRKITRGRGFNPGKISVRDGVDAAVDAYVRARYGYRIAIIQLQNALKAMEAPSAQYSVSRGESVVEKNISQQLTLSFGVTSTPVFQVCKDVVRVRAVSYDEWSTTMAEDLGLSLRGVPYAAWDALPYSFVVDWFTTFGLWLKAVVPITPDIVNRGSCYTVVRETTTSWTTNGPTTSTNSAYSVTRTAEAAATLYSATRNRIVGLPPIAAPAIRPDLAGALFGASSGDWFGQYTRLVDMTALVLQRLRAR